MEVGDLIIVVEEFPDWDWIDYRTGELGLITRIRPGYHFDIMEIFFFHSGKTHPVPHYFIASLKEIK